MAIHAVIVAGGTGSRMGNALPKQFLPLAGKPIMYYCIKHFLDAFGEDVQLTIVMHPSYTSHFNDVLLCFEKGLNANIVAGGETRFDSVKNGIMSIAGDAQDIVMVHDAARPFANAELLKQLHQAALAHGSALPVLPIAESMRLVKDNTSEPIVREHYRIVQTPQCFTLQTLLEAFSQPYQSTFTDEATVVQSSGGHVHLVEGIAQNIKLTTPQDLAYAEFLLQQTK
jgi:2-C-methyl-D-erythritol 4-phosphate cytidylyltransferase